jgi:outer membrane protein
MLTFNRVIPFLALCGLLAAGQASAEIKIGYVEFNKLLEDAPQTKTAMQTLENEFGPRRRELMTMQNDLKAKEDRLQKEGAVMSDGDRNNAEKTFRDQQREFSRKANEFQDDASTRKNEELGKVQRYLVQQIRDYATSQGFDLVLTDVVYAKQALDITPAVLTVLQSKPAAIPASAAPSPAKTPAPAKPTGSNK